MSAMKRLKAISLSFHLLIISSFSFTLHAIFAVGFSAYKDMNQTGHIYVLCLMSESTDAVAGH